MRGRGRVVWGAVGSGALVLNAGCGGDRDEMITDPRSARLQMRGRLRRIHPRPGRLVRARCATTWTPSWPLARWDLGCRSGGTELWIDPADALAIFIVDGGRIKRWPAGQEILCD